MMTRSRSKPSGVIHITVSNSSASTKTSTQKRGGTTGGGGPSNSHNKRNVNNDDSSSSDSESSTTSSDNEESHDEDTSTSSSSNPPAVVVKKKSRKKDKDTSSSSSSSSSSTSSSESSYEEEEFEIDQRILEDAELGPKVEKVMDFILKKTPTLEDILKTPMRLRHKAKIFELLMIYEQTMPMTEDRMILRSQLSRLFEVYKHDFRAFRKHRDKILQFEKATNGGDGSLEFISFQQSILDLEVEDSVKLVLYRKFVELRDSPEMDSKLKVWLTKALQLPYNRIKQFPSSLAEQTEKLQFTKTLLDKELYGMPKVKEQLLLYLHTKLVNPTAKGCSLGLVGPPGVGKCLHPDVKVCMWDGTWKYAKDIRVHDQLMGDDFSVRTVQSTTTGREMMYRIQSDDGTFYGVNGSHILTVVEKGKEAKGLVDMSLAKALREYDHGKQLWSVRSVPFSIPWPFPVTNDNDRPLMDWHMRYHMFQKYLMQKGYSQQCESVVIETPFDPILAWLCHSLHIPFTKPSSTIMQFSEHVLTDTDRPYTCHAYRSMEIVQEGHGEYVGFCIDGNGRFLLHDFTVTHNTSIAKCLARAMELPFEQITMGGTQTTEFLKGHDFTYVGSQPGEIARCLMRMQYKNGILFFDEFEKVAQHPEVMASLLHITDFSQNNEYRDNYFADIPMDLSSLWFIYSMNELPTDQALVDRIFMIRVEGYSEDDKVNIVKNHLLPKFLENLHLSRDAIVIDTDVARYLIQKSSCSSLRSKGVRDVERILRDVVTKLSFLHNHPTIQTTFQCQIPTDESPIVITRDMVDRLTKDVFDTPIPLQMYL